jgi:hypothetical protein
VVAAFDKSFAAWKSEVDESLASVKLELTKLNSFFDREARQSLANYLSSIFLNLMVIILDYSNQDVRTALTCML